MYTEKQAQFEGAWNDAIASLFSNVVWHLDYLTPEQKNRLREDFSKGMISHDKEDVEYKQHCESRQAELAAPEKGDTITEALKSLTRNENYAGLAPFSEFWV